MQRIVRAGAGHFQRALGVLLSLDVGKVHRIDDIPVAAKLVCMSGRLDGFVSIEMPDQRLQSLHRIDLHAVHQGGLRRIHAGHKDAAPAVLPRQVRQRQHAADVAHGAVQTQLAHDECVVQVGEQLPRRGEDADGDGQVIGGPTLRRSAGARLTVRRWLGKKRPLLVMAERTRSLLSRTAASGRPTTVIRSSPLAMSTSTWTGRASRPMTAQLCTLASTGFLSDGLTERGDSAPKTIVLEEKVVNVAMAFSGSSR